MTDHDIQKAYALGATPADIEKLKALKLNWAKLWPLLFKILQGIADSGVLGGESAVPAE